MAERLGDIVAAEELNILDWLEGQGDFLAKATRNGIEITMSDGRFARTVFVHMSNFHEHLNCAHLDFQWENATGKVLNAEENAPEGIPWEMIVLEVEHFFQGQ